MVLQYQGTEGLHRRIERERKEYFNQTACRKIVKFRDYTRGKQAATLTAEQRRVLMGVLGNEFSDNVCQKILSVATGRTELLRWTCEDQSIEEWLMQDIWLKNQYGTMQSEITYRTLRDGNHAIGIRIHYPLDPETGKKAEDAEGRIQFTHEPWWDGKTGVFFKYDEHDNELYAVKEWYHVNEVGEKKRRRTVYWPHKIQRFIEDGGWKAYVDPADADSESNVRGEIPWVREDGRPLGIPMVHFTSIPKEDDAPYGISHLDGGVLAFQDQINSLQYDLSAAALYAGYQMTWSTGTTLPISEEDPTRKVPPKIGPGQHFHADEPEAKIGVIPSGDVEAIKDAYRLKMQAVCRMTDTPLHFITGEWPSGEALLRAEIDLVEFSRRFVEATAPEHTKLAHRATVISNTFLETDWNEEAPIVSLFSDPQRRDRLTMSQIATTEELYPSVQERLRMTGRTKAQIDLIMSEMQEQAEADMEMATKTLEAEGEVAAIGTEKATDEEIRKEKELSPVRIKEANSKPKPAPAPRPAGPTR